MCPPTLICPLCLSLGSELKALVNENGQNNEIYEVAAKYFDPFLLTTVMCVDCWKHIDEFHEFQQSVFNAQARIGKVEIEPLAKLETVLVTRTDDVGKTEPVIKLESLTIRQDNNDDNLKETMNIPINDSVNSVDYNPFSSDDEIPLTKYSETLKSCINSEGQTLYAGDSSEHDDKLLFNEYSRESKEDTHEHNTTHTEQTYHCPHCPRKFAVKRNLRAHVKNIHTKEHLQYQCLYCPSKSKFRQSMRRHIKKLHPKELKAYSNIESKLFETIKVNQTEQGFQCPYCPSKLQIKKSIRRHVKSLHPTKYLEYSNNISKQAERAFQCPFCPVQLAFKKNIRRHVKYVHPKEYVEYSFNPPTIRHATSNNNSTILNDEFSETKAHVSDSQIICEKLKKSVEKLTSGEKTIDVNHQNDYTILNEDSSKIINNKNNPTSEVETIDVDDTTKYSYLCPYCPAKIRTKENVPLHIKKLHPKEFVEYIINDPKKIQMDSKLKSSMSDDEFSKIIKENNEAIELADENLRGNKNISVKDLVNLTDYNPLSSDDDDDDDDGEEDDDIPLTEYSKTSKSPINVKEETSDDEEYTQGERKFKCTICGRKYKRASYLREHSATHDENTFQCIHCPKKFELKRYLHRHIKNVHSTQLTRYQCVHCPTTSKMKISIRRHIKKFHPKEFMEYSNNESKLFKICQSDDIEKLYLCPYCPAKVKLINRHIKKKHPKKFVEYCANKPKITQVPNLQKDCKVKCSICSTELKNAMLLRQHMKYKHTGYQCSHCPQIFQERKDLRHHFEHSHPTEFEVFSDYDGFIAKWEKELECYLCKNKFANFNLLNKHFEVEHPKNKCHVLCCGLKLSYRLALVEHIRLHLDPNFFTCKICGKRAATGRNLRIHMRTHIKDPQLQCKVCNKYFINKGKLLLHSGIHITEKHHKCNVCSKGFSTELLRKKHELNYHKGKLLCDQCGKSYFNLNSLKQHQLVHVNKETPDTETPKLPCEICGAEFKTQDTLHTHKKTFHTDNSKAYVCSECGKLYSCKVTLNQHKKIVHTTKRFKCTMCDKEFKYVYSFRQHKATHSLRNLLQCPHCPSKFTRNANLSRHLKIYHPTEYAKINRRKRTKADFSLVKQTIVI